MTTRKRLQIAVVAVAALALTACGGGFDDGGEAGTSAPNTTPTDKTVQVLIGSSGQAETDAVTSAVTAWSEESGIPAEVVVASDLAQQLSQGFAGGDPADLFYMSADQLNTFAANGSVLAYGDNLANKDSFYPSLVSAFTVNDKFYCAPKDFSTLALVINDRLWAEAGLTDADYPKTWEDLAAVSQKLTSDDVVGLAFGPELQRVGVFMAQAGGSFVSEDGTQATLNSEENVKALTYVKDNLAAGNFAFSSDLGAGWGGEAFGKEMAAMVIEGNWITGAMKADFPDVAYTVVELPRGPKGQGTIQYTNCWGIAADADNTAGAQQLAEFLTTPERQMDFAKAFGVMPSVQSAQADWMAEYPAMGAFIAGASYAVDLPSFQGSADVIADFNAQLASLKTTDPKALLDSVNASLQAAIDSAK